MRRSLVLFMLVLGTGLAVQAQQQRFHIRLYGLVTDYFSGDPMKGVLVRVLKDSLPIAEVTTKNTGRYEFFLDRGAVYTVWFSRDALVTKHVRIDAREVPVFPDVPYYEMDVQMTMFEWIEGIDYAVFDEPLGEALYKYSVRNLSWNLEYTESRRPLIAETMKDYEKLVRKYRPKKSYRPPDRL